MPNFHQRRYGKYDFITVGWIVNELRNDGIKLDMITFNRLEKAGLFMSGRTVGGFRRYTEEEARIIIHLIKENFGHEERT